MNHPRNAPLWAKIPKITHFRRKCPYLGKTPENRPYWANMSLSWAKYSKIPLFWAKMSLYIRYFRKYHHLGQKSRFGQKLENTQFESKMPLLGENALFGEFTTFWAKKPHFGQQSRKYTILGENFENAPFWARMPFLAKIQETPHFGRKSRRYPISGENALIQYNLPFFLLISSLSLSLSSVTNALTHARTSKRCIEPVALAKNCQLQIQLTVI